EAAERAEAARQMASARLEPTRIRGNYGATAFVRRSWIFEVVNLDQVPRADVSLDVPVVRAAITQDGIRQIPGLRIFQTEGLRVRATTSPHGHRARSQRKPAVKESNSAEAATHQSADHSAGPHRGRGCVPKSAPPSSSGARAGPRPTCPTRRATLTSARWRIWP